MASIPQDGRAETVRMTDLDSRLGQETDGHEVPERAGNAKATSRVIEFRDGEIKVHFAGSGEFSALSPEDVDFHWDAVRGPISIRLKGGGFRKYFGRFPGIGENVGIPFLLDLLWAEGALMTITDLTRNPLLHSFWDSWPRATRLAALRKTFGDSAADSFYFICLKHPYRVGWNIERSWRIIEKSGFAGDGK